MVEVSSGLDTLFHLCWELGLAVELITGLEAGTLGHPGDGSGKSFLPVFAEACAVGCPGHGREGPGALLQGKVFVLLLGALTGVRMLRTRLACLGFRVELAGVGVHEGRMLRFVKILLCRGEVGLLGHIEEDGGLFLLLGLDEGVGERLLLAGERLGVTVLGLGAFDARQGVVGEACVVKTA